MTIVKLLKVLKIITEQNIAKFNVSSLKLKVMAQKMKATSKFLPMFSV